MDGNSIAIDGVMPGIDTLPAKPKEKPTTEVKPQTKPVTAEQRKGFLAKREAKSLFEDTLSLMYFEVGAHGFARKTEGPGQHYQEMSRAVFTNPETKGSFACTWRVNQGFGADNSTVEMSAVEVGKEFPRVLAHTRLTDAGGQKRHGKPPEYSDLSVSDTPLPFTAGIDFMRELKKAEFDPQKTQEDKDREIRAAGGTDFTRQTVNVKIGQASELHTPSMRLSTS